VLKMVRVFAVGGSVRDQFLGVPSKDVDYSVEAESYEEMLAYVKSRGKVFLEQPQYFTVRAHVDGLGDADFVLCRKDGEYHDGRRPDTVEVGTVYDDLARRDFTVNAMAVDTETGDLLDPFDGMTDLKTRTLRCVGNPYERFSEDALRMVRALRFSVTKGFDMHPSVVEQLSNPELVELLRSSVSVDRKREELARMFRFNTKQTLVMLGAFPEVADALLDGGLWLKPTTEKTS
jgi:tRNA nucleotidyltransferase (CCA-adding enzyme)